MWLFRNINNLIGFPVCSSRKKMPIKCKQTFVHFLKVVFGFQPQLVTISLSDKIVWCWNKVCIYLLICWNIFILLAASHDIFGCLRMEDVAFSWQCSGCPFLIAIRRGLETTVRALWTPAFCTDLSKGYLNLSRQVLEYIQWVLTLVHFWMKLLVSLIK